MARDLTDAQRQLGASGVAYRAQQLADVARLLASGVTLTGPAWVLGAVNNALVESALVNARVLAWFFSNGPDASASWFNEDWDDDVQGIAGEIVGTISRHLSHATAGGAAGEPHPGAWPISEFAWTLVSALDRFVRSIEIDDEVLWFAPAPTSTLKALSDAHIQNARTSTSNNPSVKRLTTRLQRYLGHSL